MNSPPWGHVAEWLRNGLQNRVHQFNSGRGLQLHLIDFTAVFGSRRVPSKRSGHRRAGAGTAVSLIPLRRRFLRAKVNRREGIASP